MTGGTFGTAGSMPATSTLGAVATLVLAAAALVVWPDPGAVVPPRIRRGRRETAPALRGVVAGIAIASAGLLVAPGGWWIDLPLAAAVGAVVARQAPRPKGREMDARRAELAVTCDLLAACLQSGMAVGAALAAVSGAGREDGTSAVVGRQSATTRKAANPADARRTGTRRTGTQRKQRTGTRRTGTERTGTERTGSTDAVALLAGVASLLLLGADARAAWRAAAEHPDLAPVAAAARRSAVGGTGLVEALQEQAQRLRSQGSAAAARSAGRAGVLMAGPLGLCFLPAFLCLGLAPVVIGLLGKLDLF